MRPSGLGLAPGFAQVLQAFDPGPDSSTDSEELAPAAQRTPDATETDDKPTETQNAEDGTDGADAADAQKDSDKQADGTQASDEQAAAEGSGAPTARGDGNPADQTMDTKAVRRSQPAKGDANAQTEIQHAARLELLVHRGDLAKLSMRGLVRSLRAQSSPDLTAIAVQTRTGELSSNEPPAAQASLPASRKPEGVQPDPAPPTPQRVGPAVNESSSALSDTVPTSPRVGGESTPRAIAQPPSPPDAPVKGDQGRTDVQQARSIRVDAGGAVQQNAKPDLVRAASLQNPAHAAQAPRVEGALTSRAISGIESAGAQPALKGTQTQAPKLDASANDAGAQRAAVMAQVQRGLAQMLRSGKGDMTIKLTPGHLGEVRIQMKQDGERIGIRLTASTEQAREMLSSGSKELMHQLLAKGVLVERVQIDLQPPHTTGSGDGAQSGDADPGRGESHAQGDTPGQHAGHKGNEPVIPLTHDRADTPGDEHAPIWTELGLDAIA